mmetsp:Transcript_34448/g.83356  ORF Transcript_34448/g.83356 Transcript_34448/m.83356 type:complete len:90 (-) Transcript_34448:103-372(-)
MKPNPFSEKNLTFPVTRLWASAKRVVVEAIDRVATLVAMGEKARAVPTDRMVARNVIFMVGIWGVWRMGEDMKYELHELGGLELCDGFI